MPIRLGELTIIDRDGDHATTTHQLFMALPHSAISALKLWLFDRMVRGDTITLIAPDPDSVRERPDYILLDAKLNGLVGGVLLRSNSGYLGPFEVSSHT